MKARSGFGDLVMTLLLLLIGGLLIYGNTLNSEFGATLAKLLGTQLVGLGVGLIMVLSVILRWFGGLGSKKKKNRFIDFQSDDGNVGISTQAIQDFIERVCKEFAAIKSIETKLVKDKSALDISIMVKVLSGNKIPELSQMLQQRIRESVRESLGLEEIRNITIQVSEIVGEPPKHVSEENAAG